MPNLNLKIKYTPNIPEGKGTQQVINAFGLKQASENVIIDNYNLNIEYGKLYYIYGYSGSGKSSILNQIADKLQGENIIHIKKWDQIDMPSKPLIEFFPDVEYETKFGMLSKCGLAEAWKLITKYNELSDGEKFRFILYHTIMTAKPKQIIIFDEFCATLDRLTAKAISTNIRKITDKTGITFILASAHDDIADYLHADITLYKEFGRNVQTKKN